MISQERVNEVRRLLAQESPRLSQRLVSSLTGVSRHSVSAIARGKRRDLPDSGQQYREGSPYSGRLVWCTGCGHNVYLVDGECKLCLDAGTPRRYRNARPGASPPWRSDDCRPEDGNGKNQPPVNDNGDDDCELPPDGLCSPIDLRRTGANHF